jgi:hypothetical protein
MKRLKAPYGKQTLLESESKEVIECPRCGFEMKNITACHMICSNCGGHLDCSEKGLTW